MATVSAAGDALGPVLAGRVLEHGVARGGERAICNARETWTWADLARRSEQVAGAITAAGVRPGDFVVVGTGCRPEFVAAYLGTELAGGVPAVLDLSRVERANRVLETLRPAAIVHDIPGVDGRGEMRIERRPPRALDADASDRSHVLFTSGTTGIPKGIVWSKARFSADLSARRLYPPGTCLGVMAPLYHSMGFRRVAASCFSGATLALVSEPHSIAHAFAEAESLGVTMMCASATLAELILTSGARPPSTLRGVDVSGAPTTPARLVALADHLEDVAVSQSYSLTEVGTVTFLPASELRDHPASVGRPFPGCAVAINAGTTLSICDDDGATLGPGEEGSIAIQVPVYRPVDGYLDAPEEVAARFSAGRLLTSDRGMFDEHGYLVLQGRDEELLKVAGHRISAPGVEANLRLELGLEEVAVVGAPAPVLGQIPVAFVPPCSTANAQAYVSRAKERLAPYEAPRYFLPRAALPRTSLGKLERATLGAEAARWAALWPDTLLVGSRLWPAAGRRSPLIPATPTAPALVAIDALPESWVDLLPGAADAADRVLCYCAREDRHTPLAWVAIAAQPSADDGAVRLVEGPHFAAADVTGAALSPPSHDLLVAHALAALAALPGDDGDIERVRVRPGASASLAAYERLGFHEISRDERAVHLERRRTAPESYSFRCG